MIYLFPIESYEIRYTEQWGRWFPDKFKELKLDFTIVNGVSLSDTIKDGCVLDVIGTNYYKFIQLSKLCQYFLAEKIKDGDILFFTDLWFPGIEAIPYMCQQIGIKPKIAGIMHAGTYDCNDFTFRAGMNYWGKDLENSWFKFFDYIFVGSQYHKDLILRTRDCAANKITVTGLPQDSKEIRKRGRHPQPKEDVVVFPHRTDEEKQVNVFRYLSKQRPQYKWIVAREVCKTKDEYYQLLAKSKVVFSASLQETFGYGTLEAVTLGCSPVLPRRLCYPEMYPEDCLYDSLTEAMMLIDRFMEKPFVPEGIIQQADKAIERMVEVLK